MKESCRLLSLLSPAVGKGSYKSLKCPVSKPSCTLAQACCAHCSGRDATSITQPKSS